VAGLERGGDKTVHEDSRDLGVKASLARYSYGSRSPEDGTELSNRELTERLLAVYGADWYQAEFVDERKGHNRRFAVDITKIAEELGDAAAVAFDTGLLATMQWYRDNRSSWEPVKPRAALHRDGLVGHRCGRHARA
jgi:hypothetical protein